MKYIDIGLRYQAHRRNFFSRLFSRSRRMTSTNKKVMLDQYFRVPQGTNKIIYFY